MANPKDRPVWFNAVVDLIVLSVCVAIVIWVLARPSVVLAPTPRIIVLSILALLPVVVLTNRATAKLQIRVWGVVFMATGATAVVLFGLFALVHLSRPDQQVAVYHVVDEDGKPARWLENDGAVTVQAARRGAAPTHYVDGSTIVLVFPEQIETAHLILEDRASGRSFERDISYSSEQPKLRIGVDLKEVK